MSNTDTVQILLQTARSNFERDFRLDEVIIFKLEGRLQRYQVPAHLDKDVIADGLEKLRVSSDFVAHIESDDMSATVTVYEAETVTIWIGDIDRSGFEPKLGEWNTFVRIPELVMN